MRGGHQHTCQCFEVSASFDTCQCRLGLLLASAFRLPAGLLYQVYQRVQFNLENVGPYRCNRNSAISERKSCSLPHTGTRSGCAHRETPPGDYFNGILNTDLPDLPLIVPNIRIRHTSVKMARLTNFDRKGVQILFTNKPLKNVITVQNSSFLLTLSRA